MAYKKLVQGRSYPFIYNVSMAVGSHQKLLKTQVITGVVIEAVNVNTGNPEKDAQYANYLKHSQMAEKPKTVGYVQKDITQTFVQSEPNKRDDVMLVQYLLKRIYQKGQDCVPPFNPADKAAELKIDGWYGPQTQSAIQHFQFEMKRNGRNIATDGCIDPERGESTVASISKTHYTISWLNKYFWILYPTLAPNIGIDPECPPELSQAISHCQM